MSGVKELALLLWRLQLIAQLNRFLALQALVECLGMWMATFGLKFPILLNWVRFMPGIWVGGVTSSTDDATDNSPTLGCLGLAPSRLSKQWGIDILPIFLLRLGSSPSDVDRLLGLSGDLGRFFVNNVEVIDGGERVVKILAVFQYSRCCRFGVFFDPFS